jgi:predicted DNA-binding antitoxin AbrB/MazE fold protein
MRNYFVIEIKEGAEVKLEIVLESFYNDSFKDKLLAEGKKVRIISSFEYYL